MIDKNFFNKKHKILDFENPFSSSNIKNAASKKMQNKWKGMNSSQRNVLRKKHKDTDGDRIPDIFDCQPNNIMRQDKVLWPKHLRKNNINLKNVSPKQKRIIQKQFRKNPELLSRKNKESKINFAVDNTLKTQDAHAYVSGLNERGEEARSYNESFKEGEYKLALGNHLLKQKYDPAFEDFMMDEDKQLPGKRVMYEEALKQKKKYKNPAFNNISRTLSHEMQHVKQIDGESGGRFDNFIRDYNRNREYYEEDADRYAAEQLERKKSRGENTYNMGGSVEWFSEGPGASQKKQDEWAEMSSSERNQERRNKPDVDGDRVPDEYDCDPDNTMRQDNYLRFITEREENDNNKEAAMSVDLKDENRDVRLNPKNLKGIDAKNPDDVKFLSNSINHEVLHFAINDVAGKKASSQLDNITPTVVQDDDGTTINKDFVGTVQTPEKARMLTVQYLNKKIPKEASPTQKWRRELRNEQLVESTYDRFKNREVPGASQKKQDEWAEMSRYERNQERRNKPDIDGDRVPDEYDCEPDNIMRQDTIWSVRSFKEKAPNKKIYSSDNYHRMKYGRNTGWFGTGVYGYDSQRLAKEDPAMSGDSYYGSDGYLRTFEIEKPIKLSDSNSDLFHETSKQLFQANTDDERELVGIKLKSYVNKQFTPEEIAEIQEEAKQREIQPINIVAERTGYDGVIPGPMYQNRRFGSVKFYDKYVPGDTTALSLEEKQKRKQANLLNQKQREAEKQREVENQYNKYAEILDNPYPVSGSIGIDSEGNEIEKNYTQEEKEQAAKKYYGEEEYRKAFEWQTALKEFDR